MLETDRMSGRGANGLVHASTCAAGLMTAKVLMLLYALSVVAGCAGLRGIGSEKAAGHPMALGSTKQAAVSTSQFNGASIQPDTESARTLVAQRSEPVVDIARVQADNLAEVVPASHLAMANRQACSCSSDCPNGCSMPCTDCPVNGYSRGLDPQEHIFDGGDLAPSVVVRQDWNAVGVDTTDTVVYYETAGGKVCVQPSNRVAIYAPRFGAVRQVTGAVFAEGALAPGRMLAPQAADGIEDINRADGLALSTGPIAQKQIQQLDRFHEDKRMVRLTSVLPPTPVSDAVAALINVDVSAVDLAAIRETIVEETRTAMVETTFLPESISVIIAGQEAAVMVNSKRPAEVHVYEIPDRCSIRITKTASHTMASPGDVVRFTIRFDNIGPNKVGNIVIIDSLSSRLEYIEGSQLCSLGTRFSTEPNDVGSSKLRWELESPLKPNEGGVVSFDCRVR